MKEKTKDYETFKIYPGNRPIDKTNVEQLVSSISENNLLEQRPILINENMEILDGQHRLEAAKILQVPIFYEIKIGGNHKDIVFLNSTQKNWKKIDHLRLYSEGIFNENYILLQKFMNEHNLKLEIALLLINGPIKSMNDYEKFRKGEFIFPQKMDEILSYTEKVKYFWTFIKSHNIKPLFKFTSTSFIKPLLIFLEHPNLNWDLFCQKIDQSWYKIGPRPSHALYLEMLCEIYNFRNQNKILFEGWDKKY